MVWNFELLKHYQGFMKRIRISKIREDASLISMKFIKTLQVSIAIILLSISLQLKLLQW